VLMDRDFPILHSPFLCYKCEPLAFITRQPHYQDVHNYLTELAFYVAVLLPVSFTVPTNSPPSARQGLFFLRGIARHPVTCPACRRCYSITVWSHHWQHSAIRQMKGDDGVKVSLKMCQTIWANCSYCVQIFVVVAVIAKLWRRRGL